jgi:DHA3 family macrolide efflux protein-like MFS transporter
MANWKTRFFTIWIVQAVSFLGSGLTQFALVWWLTTSTGSATVLVVSTLVAMLPMIVLGPFAGALADRWNRRLILIASDGAVALTTLALLLVFLSGNLQVWHVYLATFIRSTAGAFHFPTMQASTSLMVPKEHLARVGGLNQTLFGLNSILAPPLGALLLDVFGMGAALLVDVVTAALAITPLIFFAIPQPPAVQHEGVTGIGAHLWRDMRDGFRYVAHWPGLIIILVMAMLINLLLTPAFSLLPLMVSKVLEGGAGVLATAEAAFGVGIIVGGALLAAWGGFKSRIVTSLVGLAGLGVGCLLIGFVPVDAIWVLIAGMAIVGMMQSFTNGPFFAILQTVVDPGMQARVMSLLGSLSGLMAPVGLLLAGPLADQIGLRIWYVMGAVVCLIMAGVGYFIPALRTIEQQKGAYQVAADIESSELAVVTAATAVPKPGAVAASSSGAMQT